ncbi:T-cell surface glycoprotein CD4-like [Eleutherodactylus coqui]|uniref:T-cell surface glycoprotein CD4-like n=1 Tax=Eleutherodactylus coqui TaxID=57060 RepID=UPI003463033F
MKENLWGICLTFLYVKTCVSLPSSDKVLAEVGKDVSLPCGKDTNGDIIWLKDKIPVIKYIKERKTYGSNAKDQTRYSVPSHRTNDLSLKDVKMIDSGTYICQYQQTNIRTVELFVFQVSVSPSTSLLLSEDLVMELTSSPSPVPGLVSWEKDGTEQSTDPKLEENNVQLNSKGLYVCRIKIDGGNKLDISRQITVFGFHDPPPIVYTSGKSPVILPWIFNFKIRDKLLLPEVHVEKGFITYQSNVLNQLNVMEGAASWPATSNSRDATQISNDLSIHLLNPEGGLYRVEILLRIGDRKKNLIREVYLASLTVPVSNSDISPNTKVPLECKVDRIDIKWTLCWHQWQTSHEKCGKPGNQIWNTEVTAGNETVVTWTCSVTSGKERLASANVTLAVKPDLLDPSSSLFWVMVGVGIFILLLTVVFITLVIAWKRRVRRARHRAWLLENLHQQRRCECKGFSPQRLKENI